MEALKRKLNSRRGASILLALLFMLMCILVAASVVMAAASNAGKIKSNKEEQQKYLTLSSAVNLLVDELQSVEYVGGYVYSYDAKTMIRGSDGNLYKPGTSGIPGDPGETEEVTVSTYNYTLRPGKWQYQQAPSPSPNPAIKVDDWGENCMREVLPLNDYLNYLFLTEFKEKYKEKHESGSTYKTDYYYKLDPELPDSEPEHEYTLTLTLKKGDSVDLSNQQVKIDVEMLEDGRIELTATLRENGSDTQYQMVAMLRTRSGKWPVNVMSLTAPKSGYNPFDPVRWELAYIYKVNDKVVDPDETP